MDALDLALMEAWERVGQRLLDRPWERVKRMERVRRAELRRPVRAWAVCVRASDHRIGDGGYSADRPWGDFGCETSWHLERKGRRHRVTLTGRRLAELIKPVRVVEPVDVKEMARLLGRDVRTVVSWRERGVLAGEQTRLHAGQRRAKWMLRTVGGLDPQADGGRGPSGWWGTTWEHHWERVPADLWVRLKRVPRVRVGRCETHAKHGHGEPGPVAPVLGGDENLEHSGCERFVADRGRRPRLALGDAGFGQAGVGGSNSPGRWVGWDWVCPGRVVVGRGGERVRVACGRVCKKLWLPLPSWGVGQYLAGRGGAGEAVWEAMAVAGLFGAGLQGVEDEVGERFGLTGGTAAGSLACAKCWGLRHEPVGEGRLRAEAWNRFVTVVSGGLLYGREVVEPAF
ncbi:MAG: hypothetical protein AAGC44_12135 [Planctomycetota bacterium]